MFLRLSNNVLTRAKMVFPKFYVPKTKFLRLCTAQGDEINKQAKSLHTEGRNFIKQGNYNKGASVLQAALKLTPNDVQILNDLAITYSLQGKLSSAVEILKTATNLQSDRPRSHYNLGITYQQLGQFQDSRSSLQRAVDLDPNYESAISALSEVETSLGNIESAEKYRKRLFDLSNQKRLTTDRISAEMHYNMGKLYLRSFENSQDESNLEKACECLQKAIDADYSFTEPYFELAQAYGYLERHSEAIRVYRRLLDSFPYLASVQHQLGLALCLAGKPYDALVHLEEHLRLVPESGEGCFDLATTYMSVNRLDEALKYFEKVIALVPDHVEAHVNMGYIYMEKKQYGPAIESFNAALRLDPDNLLANYNLVSAYEVLGKFNLVNKYLARLEQVDPGGVRLKEHLELFKKFTEPFVDDQNKPT